MSFSQREWFLNSNWANSSAEVAALVEHAKLFSSRIRAFSNTTDRHLCLGTLQPFNKEDNHDQGFLPRRYSLYEYELPQTASPLCIEELTR